MNQRPQPTPEQTGTPEQLGQAVQEGKAEQGAASEVVSSPEIVAVRTNEQQPQPAPSSTQVVNDNQKDLQEPLEVSSDNLIEHIAEPIPTTDLDKTFVKAADEVIDQYEGRPFEEEEEHHKLQIKYLWLRLKRRIGKKE